MPACLPKFVSAYFRRAEPLTSMPRITHCAALALLIVFTSGLFATQNAQANAKQATQQHGRIERDEQKQLDKLMEDYYQEKNRFEPFNATFSGDNRFDSLLGMSIAPTERARHFAAYGDFNRRLQRIKLTHLSAAQRGHVEVLKEELRSALSLRDFPDHLLPINHMSSTVIVMANLASGESSQPLNTPSEVRAYHSRLQQLGKWIDQAIANMREGMKSGIVQPAALVQSALPQYQKLRSATAESSVFYLPIKRLPSTFSESDKSMLTNAFRDTIEKEINPKLVQLAEFLEKEYLPAARTSAGLSALPNGTAWYLAKVATLTTTTLTPKQIHEIGLAEVARIQAQFAALAPRLGFDGPANTLPSWVAAQEKFRPFSNEQQALERYREINRTLEPLLPKFFSQVPKAALDVRLEPELTRATASNHYTGPAEDGSRPGIFWAVVIDAKTFNATGMITLLLHEGRPGHHFQVALQQELDLPAFRRFGRNNVFGEGWALYAETLGKEMGLYEDPAAYFGHLQAELFRATRLVVDTGIHAFGWTREDAILYLRNTMGNTEAQAKQATERYMAWPGQALGYKIGALKIAELRSRAEKSLGQNFSLPEFHSVILGDGSLPLNLLEAKVDKWLAAKR